MDVLFAAEAAVQEVVPAVVQRHRSTGVLTWKLLRQMEEEVLNEAASTGNHSRRILDMLRAPASFRSPSDDQVVAFEGRDFVPIVYGAIAEAWHDYFQRDDGNYVSDRSIGIEADLDDADLFFSQSDPSGV